MTTRPETDTQAAQISAETKRVLRDFVRAAAAHLSEALNHQAPEWEVDSRWERGPDGHFREHTKRTRSLWPALRDEWLRSAPDYGACVERLKSDLVIGPHLDRLVGTKTGALRLKADHILRSAVYAMLNDEGVFAFNDQQFDHTWQSLADFFGTDRIARKLVAPVPHLAVPDFPLRLNNEIELDRLTEEEVTRCCQVGVLRPEWPRFPLIDAEVAVGIRKSMFVPKLIWTGDEPRDLPEAADEGRFGHRPLFRDDLIVDDVLSALRLFKHAAVRTAGHASWCDSLWLNAGTSYRVLRQWPYGGQCELSADEVPHFLDLWHLLEEGATRFGFSIHRFNLAFDRGLLADRIVDLVIAAESLFLGDLDVQDRGELRFRFAVRAAKFIEHPSYGEQDVFRVMRRAYDARSAIVHGG